MGDTATPNFRLLRVMQHIDKKQLRRARWLLEREDSTAVDTGHAFVDVQISALYKYISALIWLLKEDDPAWAANLAEAKSYAGWSPELEADTLYEHAVLLTRHKWRTDIVPRYLRRVVNLSREEQNRVRRARALTTWGQLLYGQKLYEEAKVKLDNAEAIWTAVRNKPGHMLSDDEKRWIAETNWLLLRTLVAQKADKATINQVARKAIRHDPSMARKTAAATALRWPDRKSKASDA